MRAARVGRALRARGLPVDYIAADMADPAAPAALIAEALRLSGGRLDILVNNAGIAQHGDTESFPEETYRRLMAINLDAVFFADLMVAFVLGHAREVVPDDRRTHVGGVWARCLFR